MPRKKKPFLNKKTAMKFEIVSRSMDDAALVAGEVGEHILRPMNQAAAEAQMVAMARGDDGVLGAPVPPPPGGADDGEEESKSQPLGPDGMPVLRTWACPRTGENASS